MLGELNSKKQGDGIKRKNNCIVNTGGKLTREEVEERRKMHRERFEVKDEVWRNIVLPRPDNPLVVLDRKREELKVLRNELQDVLKQIDVLEQMGSTDSVDAAVAAAGNKRQRE
ncbi:hypothetical protein LPJ57_005238 [Coemansia sp. RSA 486]|nr:hypothetical protein LPJ57_005238 [Coemansia sp. RSA 486]